MKRSSDDQSKKVKTDSLSTLTTSNVMEMHLLRDTPGSSQVDSQVLNRCIPFNRSFNINFI